MLPLLMFLFLTIMTAELVTIIMMTVMITTTTMIIPIIAAGNRWLETEHIPPAAVLPASHPRTKLR